VDAAAVGKASSARKQLAEARRIDVDEVIDLGEAETKVEAHLARFQEDNPKWSIGFSLTWGSLGVEPDDTLAQYVAPEYSDADANRPLGIGMQGRIRLGRYLQTWVTGGLRRSNADFGYASDTFMSVTSVGLGIGYRSIRNANRNLTIRNANRNLSFQFGGGITNENVTIEADIPGLDDKSDGRAAAFARAAIEGRHTAFWVEHGFGFEDDTEDSPVVWSDTWMIGLTYSFH
jgi:hypothetical protein